MKYGFVSFGFVSSLRDKVKSSDASEVAHAAVYEKISQNTLFLQERENKT
ncbi:hypothetical protein TNCT_491401, partial [Trichonephila clavata]